MTVAQDLPPSVGTGFVWRPSTTASAVAVLVHGLQSHAGWFLDAGERLACAGLAVYAPDRRGSGRSTAPRGDIGSFREWFSDLAEVVSLASSEHPNAAIHLVGHCFGANIALGAVLSGTVCNARSIVMLTPGLYVLPTYSVPDRLGIAVSSVIAPTRRFRVPQDDGLFSRDPSVLAWIGRDALGARSVTARALLQTNRMLTDVRSSLPSLPVPTLILEAARDRLSDNAQNRRLLTSALGSRCHYETFDAEHFLLAEPCADQVLEAIVRWTQTCHMAN
ncbi:MAG: alpha/beta fold hydrolase [Chloroflexi bacterium]|nr:alpha/beta fold hydrolase [Chloroflexota bacterium]